MMKKTVLALGLSLPILSVGAADLPKVATSIKPVSMIVKAVAGDYAEIEQIITNSASPHDVALKPSDLRKIHQADTVVWVGESLETFLEKNLVNANKLDSSIEWLELEGMVLSSYGDEHKHHEHEEDHHDHDKHEEHDHHDHEKHEEHDHHDHEKHEEHDHHDHEKHEEHNHHDHEKHEEHDSHAGHDHSGIDPHVWLSPKNAITLAQAVSKQLSEIAPAYKSNYEANLQNFILAVEQQNKQSQRALKKMQGVKYIVFHDAYHYFEDYFGIGSVGEVSVNPERKPGAKKIAHLRHLIEDDGVSCIYAEPQFGNAIIHSLAEDLAVKIGVLDPLGTEIALSKTAYSEFIADMTQSFLTCEAH